MGVFSELFREEFYETFVDNEKDKHALTLKLPSNYQASDIQKLAGITYRQLNDWENKGVIPKKVDRSRGWRKFNSKEVFALMICAAMRDEFGIPANKLKHTYSVLTSSSNKGLGDAVIAAGIFGGSVWYITDFYNFNEVMPEYEVIWLMEQGLIQKWEQPGLVFIRVNSMIEKIAEHDNLPKIEDHRYIQDLLKEHQKERTAASDIEHTVLQLIRSQDLNSIKIEMQDGEIKQIRKSKSLDAKEYAKSIQKLLVQEDFQRVTLTRRDGCTVSITQEVTQKSIKG